MMVGIPGAGKSTLCEAYRRQGCRVLSSDEIRLKLRSGLPDGELPAQNAVFGQIVTSAREALSRGQSVVMDATNLRRRHRMAFLHETKDFACLRRCVLVITPLEVCQERNALRRMAQRAPERDMRKMLSAFECPWYGEGWDEIVPVPWPEPCRVPLEAMVGFDQENPHHSRTLDGHARAAVAYCREKGWSEMLQRVALYHDVGKLWTKSRETVHGDVSENAHYRSHENWGAYVYLTERVCGQALTEAEFRQALYETCLINSHMRPLMVWQESKKSRRRDVRIFGEAFIRDLEALHEADRAAH